MNNQTTIAAVVASAIASSALAGDPALYEQLNNNDAGGTVSENEPNGFYGRYDADNFTASDNWLVDRVTWAGFSESFNNQDMLENVEGFTIRILEDNGGGLPGTQIYTETFDLADISRATTGGTGVFGGIEYNFSADLGAAVALDAGTQYWFSTAANLFDTSLSGDSFIWSRGQLADDMRARFAFGDGWAQQTGSGDSTFGIYGTVPTPGTLFAPAMLGLAATRRRR